MSHQDNPWRNTTVDCFQILRHERVLCWEGVRDLIEAPRISIDREEVHLSK